MYSEKDLDALHAQLKRRRGILFALLALFLAGIVVSLIIRIEALTIGLTIAAGMLAIAVYDLALRPIKCYITHVDNMLHGRTREIDGIFRSLNNEVSLVDGVSYHALTLEVPDDKGTPTERLFYFDRQKDFPAYQPGDALHVVYHDREIASLAAKVQE